MQSESNGLTMADEMPDTHKNAEVDSKKKEPKPSVPYCTLYRFARCFDWFLIIFGTLVGTFHGAGIPLMFVLFGELTTEFTTYGRYQLCNLNYSICSEMNLTNLTEAEWNTDVLPGLGDFKNTSLKFVLYFVYLACTVFVLATIQVGTWALQAVRQAKQIRIAYFRAILRQDIGFHDSTSPGELNSRLADDIKKIKDGMGEKVSTTIQNVSMTLSGFAVAFFYSWKLSLVTLSISPLLVISSALLFMVSDIYVKKELAAYASAGSIAEETISAIRTVVAFGCQQKEVSRYVANLSQAKKVGILRGFVTGFSLGLIYLSMFAIYGLAFWYGSTLVIAGEISVGNMTTAFFGILIASFGLGSSGSNFGAFAEAQAAGAKVFEVINRVPIIDIFSKEGDSPNPTNGEISFVDVGFSYPSRPDVEILKRISLKIAHGKTTALVGQSGSGKSTIIQLIQRFYDVSDGSVLVGGKDVKTLNVIQHRNLIGVVAQEPVLFSTTIAENIRWGREGITDEEVIQAAKQANAYEFIKKLPKQLETMVGEGGGQMSGGQKQRIAIARAIARNPKILLLDEATSALDTESESVVQAALEKASEGRTTVVVAHRLSTIRKADKIIAFQDGKIMEEGTHSELLEIPNGVYRNLINMQAGREGKEEVEGVENSVPDITQNTEQQNVDAQIRRKSIQSLHKSSTSARAIRQRRSSSIFSFGKSEGKLPIEEEEEEKEDLPEFSFGRVLKMNKPEWCYMAIGCVFSACAGSVDPVNAVVFAEVLTIFTIADPDVQNKKAILYGLLFLALGGAGFLAYILESTLFAKSGMELTVRLRKRAFQSMLRQDIAYFDDLRNSTGALTTRLSTDASRVQGCTGVRLGLMIKNCCALGVALGIAFAYGWKLSLLTLAFVPFLAFGGFLEMQLLTGEEQAEQNADEEAGQIAGEAITNIRTLASLTKEKAVYNDYVQKLSGPVKKATRKALMIGIGYGYSQCVIYFSYAAAFRLGIELVITGEMTFENVFKVLTAVIFGAMAVGQNSSFAPDFAEASVSAARMFALFDRVPEIDAYSTEGQSPDHCRGEIRITSAFFRYPSRPDVPILRGLDIVVKPGETLALVGQSGCGKSTTVQLIERFFDPQQGQVVLDGCDIRNLNLSWLRQQMGLVSQEPMLFDQSVRENIKYGDCAREATQSEVESAARNANIHDFISNLPEGYSTRVGAKGGQLSGGQKQRVAIARALLRNPKILLLDEATSALDSESEKVVQSALDAARKGRTSIVIAHRLSTVRNADQIAVIDGGIVVELGTHEALIASQGAYYSLVNAQL